MAVDPVGYIFGGTSGVPTYEELKRRRAIAVALASRQRGFPKTVGEGLTYLGESIGDVLADRRLTAQERQAGLAGAAQLAALRGASGYEPGTAPASPAAPRPPTPPSVRPPAAPASPRPAPAAPPASAAGPAPSITAAPVLPSGPSSEDMTSGPPPSEFAMGGILNAAPMAAPNLEPAFPGETGGTGQAGLVPSSGYLPPAATAAAPPSQSPAPQATAPPAPISPELQRAQDFQRSIGRPVTNAAGVPLDGVPAAPPSAPPGPQSDLTGFIAKQEGFRPTAYSDYKQTSIGYGTRGTPGETITREEAQRRLEGEVANARQSVEAFAPGAPPGVKDALTSLTYNAGPGWQRAGLGRLISEGRYDEARDRFLQYNKAGGSTLPGLVSRRNAELATLWDAQGGGAPADGQGGNIRLAAYAPDGGAGAPIPGMGGAGSPRLQPQIPPLQGPPPAPESEQITPTDIMPMPATAQFGPPVGRFSRTDAPVPGVAIPATGTPQAPAVAPPPPQGPPPATYVGSTPSREPIPPAQPQTMEPPGAPPVRNYPGGRPLSARQQRAMQMMQNPMSDPASASAAEQIFKVEEEFRKRAETQDESDYAAARTQHFHKTNEFEKFQREEADRQLKQQAARTDLEKTRADLEEKYYQQGLPRAQAAEKARLEIVEKQRDVATPKTQMIDGVLYEYKPPTPESPGMWSKAPGGPEKEGKVTETESKTLLALRRSTVAEDMLKNTGALTKMEDVYKGKVPMGIGNYLVSDEYQKTKSAADAWILHTVRHESGAAIGIHEIPSIYPIYFAMPGDSEQQMAIKDARRRNATRALYDSLGTGPARQQADKFFEDRKTRRTTEPEGTVQYNPTTKKTRRVIGGHWDYGDAD